MRRASEALVSTCRTAAARAAGSSGGISRAPSSPVRPGIPPTRVATMGRPARSASCRMSGCPSHTLGRTKTSAAASSAGTSARWPRNRTAGPSGAAAAVASSARSGPSPAMTSSGAGLRSCQRAAASISVAKPFCGASRPAATMRGRPRGSAGSPAAASPGTGAPGAAAARAASTGPGTAGPGPPAPSSRRIASAAAPRPSSALPGSVLPREGTSARPTSRAPTRRIRSSRSADTHSTAAALRATISSSAW